MITLSSNTRDSLRNAVGMIRGSKNGVVLTGAGISTPSGIPDFRSGDSGLWQNYNPLEVASLSAFRFHPEMFFNWIRPLAHYVFSALPNAAHRAITDLEKAGHVGTVITQNIDGLHQRSGSQRVYEVHGSIQTLTCVSCYKKVKAEEYKEAFQVTGDLPRCASCGNLLKPDVVLFGEQLPVLTWQQAQERVRKCDLMIVAGSSLEVLPVAGLPLQALDHGARLIVINKSETYIDVRADAIFREDVAEVLPALVDELQAG